MKIRSLFAILLLIAILLPCLAACNGNEENRDDPTESVQNESNGETDGESSEAETTDPNNEEEEREKGGLFLNIDFNSVTFPFLEKLIANGTTKEADLYPFVDQYDNTGITDLSFNIFTQISQTPSDVWMTVSDKYLQTTENGVAVDYKANFDQCYTFLETYGIDYTGVWIDRCNEIGITPWLNIRMNDAHQDGSKPYFLHDDFYYEASHLPSRYGYYSACYDYADERVTDRMLDYIEEQLMRYDAHLELDFSREMYCFDYINNPNCHEIMTEFLRDVNEIVERAEEKWGHDIKVLIRLIRDIEQNKVMGFDVQTMADEGLVDIVCPCPRWDSTDSDMPISEWVEKFPTLEIYAGLEAGTLKPTIGSDASTVYGYCANYFAQGADKIYLYNMYCTPGSTSRTNMFKFAGNMKALGLSLKRFVVTFQDICPEGFRAYKPLPAYAKGLTLEIGTGCVTTSYNTFLYVAIPVEQQLTADNLKIKVNGVECTLVGKENPVGNNYAQDGTTIYKYAVVADIRETDRQTVEFITEDSKLIVTYVELNAR